MKKFQIDFNSGSLCVLDNGAVINLLGEFTAIEPLIAHLDFKILENAFVPELRNLVANNCSFYENEFSVDLQFNASKLERIKLNLTNGPLTQADWNSVSTKLLKLELRELGRIFSIPIARKPDLVRLNQLIWTFPWGSASAVGEVFSWSAGFFLVPKISKK